MNDQDITTSYERLAQMVVRLSQDPTLGPMYLSDRIRESRAYQDEVTDILVSANRALSETRQQLAAQRAIVKMDLTPADAVTERTKLDALLERHDRLKLVKEAAHVRRQNLTRTSADVRLLLDCIKTGIPAAGAADAPPGAEETFPVQPAVDPEVDEDLNRFYQEEGFLDAEPTKPMNGAFGGDLGQPAPVDLGASLDDAFEDLFTTEEEPPL